MATAALSGVLLLAACTNSVAPAAAPPEPCPPLTATPTATPTATTAPATAPATASTTAQSATARPNIVVVMTDDLDWKLMRHTPIINRLVRDQGATASLEDEQSLCCTARASFFTGKYQHNTGVAGNLLPQGGFVRFHERDECRALPVWLHNGGYTTAFLGKYFNEYPWPAGRPHLGVRRSFVPPGWDQWFAPVKGAPYTGFDVGYNANGQVDKALRPGFVGDTLAAQAVSQIRGMPTDRPFFMEVATFTPHFPYAYPPRLKNSFRDLTAPRSPSYNERDTSDKPVPVSWLKRFGPDASAAIDRAYRNRVRGMQVVDHMVGRIVGALQARGQLDNTYLVFMSDNGYFMGDHRRVLGKYDEYQPSLSVPLYVRGPGIRPGSVVGEPVSMIDLAPTLAAMAQVPAPSDVDGLSLLDRFRGGPFPDGRKYVLLGHGEVPTYRKAPNGLIEPPEADPETVVEGERGDFAGVYSGRFKYVKFKNQPGEEFYDLRTDPYELVNLLGPKGQNFSSLSPFYRRVIVEMRRALVQLSGCAGANCTIS